MVSILNKYVPGRVFVLVAAENALIAASICGVASLRLWWRPEAPLFSLEMVQTAVVIALVCQLTFYYFDLYDLRSIRSKRELLGRLLSAFGACCLVLAIATSIVPPLRMGTGTLEITFTCVVLIILVGRLGLEWINRWITRGERIVVVGQGEMAASIVREIKGRSDLNLVLLGVVTDCESDAQLCGSTYMGAISDLPDILDKSNPDRLVLAVQDAQKSLPLDQLLSYRSRGMCIERAATLFEKLSGRIPIETITPGMLLFSDGFKKHNFLQRAISRSFSILIALIGLVLATPLMLVTAVLIKLESRGPILFRQERVGKDGCTFEIAKFRSMRVDAERSGPQWAQENDPRITRVGAILRKLRIDEIPQLVNVLVGNMSLVGPRPERPYFVDLLKTQVPYYDLRHSIRPGITGWAQVSYPYGSNLEDVKLKLEYDLFYVKNASVALDIAILFETVRTVLLGKGR